jgi:eukaryotic-like serine/threonine-protein kinase
MNGIADLQRILGDAYRVERELGAGGMATVYLAEDLKHDRRVAIKVLRPELAAIVGGERFIKEIRTTANLQHPHILPLHDSGQADGVVYYVMPYVEGESLRDRLTREKQLPVEQAVRIAREIASGLDYAHRHGIIHRDIKPENILLHDGQAVIADFGIAVAVTTAGGGSRMTETGMSLGTPHYMSPEQAMGEREVTPRSDVYSLGCVLYEMLVGEPPFTGPTAQAIIARVVTEDPRSLTAQRRTIPAYVADAATIALSKLPADRFDTAAHFAEALAGGSERRQTASAHSVAASVSRSSRWTYTLAGAAALVLIVLGVAGGWMLPRRVVKASNPARFAINTSPDNRPTGGGGFGSVALSPDGASVVYIGMAARGPMLFLRRLEDLSTAPVAGTEAAVDPVFSPDGQWIGFTSGGQFRKVSPTGGSSVAIGLPVAVQYSLWVDADEFVVTLQDGSLARIKGNQAPQVVARPDSAAGEGGLIPLQLLDDGRLLVIAQTQGVTGPVIAIDARSGKRTVVTRALVGTAHVQDGVVAWVLPTGALVTALWDGKSEVLGGQVIAPDVRLAPGSPPQITFSRDGSLVYMPAQPSELVRVSRQGVVEDLGVGPRRYHSPRFSPDGSRIAVDITDDFRDVWMLSLRDQTLTRLSFENDGHDPTWLPDGRSFLFSSARNGSVGIFRRRMDGGGSAESIRFDGIQISAHAIMPDASLAYAVRFSSTATSDIMKVGLKPGVKTEALLATRFIEGYPALSPDGQFLSYVSDESGRAEVYVRATAEGGDRIMVSQDGGSEPVWSRDGRELFYRDGAAGWLVALRIERAPELRVTAREKLFEVSDLEAANPHANYDVAPDGRFIFVRQMRATELIYIQNWVDLAKRAVAR